MRQHSKPIHITGKSTNSLKRVDFSERDYNEQWLQNIIHSHPESIPINEIEPVFADSIALCTELETKSGFCDNIFINDQGYITLIECKLWRNPQARRTVLAQLLDYAKDLSQWHYTEFERAILKARKQNDVALIDIMRKYYPDLEESSFIDNVNKNLQKAGFLLLIVGDGIRENAEELLDFLNSNVSMRFVFSFIEMPIYRMGGKDEYIITPRILAKTTELRRVIEDSGEVAEKKSPQSSQSASESEFYERLAGNIGREEAKELLSFVEELSSELDIQPKIGRGNKLSFNLKTDDDRYNLASIKEDGRIQFYAIVTKTREIGDESIGIDYLKRLANMINGQFFDKYENDWSWGVRKNGEYPSIKEFLSKKMEWKSHIEETLDRIKRIESE